MSKCENTITNILYYDGFWWTNVGEGFINLGLRELLSRLLDNYRIATFSNVSSKYYTEYGSLEKIIKRKMHPDKVKKTETTLDCSLIYTPDIVLFTGMVVGEEMARKLETGPVRKLLENGARLLLLGVGEAEYGDKNKLAHFLRAINSLPTIPLLISTRDHHTYNDLFGNVQCPLIDGIDCAFWARDSFDPSGFAVSPYDIVTYQYHPEPKHFADWDVPIVRPCHYQYTYSEKNYQIQKNIFISDSIWDYISLYANSRCVYTDLVHASIISLQFGIPVKYEFTDYRSKAFENVRSFETDNEGFMKVDLKDLMKQKDEYVCNLKMALGEGERS